MSSKLEKSKTISDVDRHYLGVQELYQSLNFLRIIRTGLNRQPIFRQQLVNITGALSRQARENLLQVSCLQKDADR